jgi:hypothetical protein
MELRKPICMTAPVKSTTIDDNATYRGTMAANPFGSRVNDDVDAMFDVATEASSTAKSIIALKPLVHILQKRVRVQSYNQWKTLGVANERKRLKVQNHVARIADTLDPDKLGLFIDGSRKVGGVFRLDKAALDSHLLGQGTKLVKGSSVNVK